MQSCVDVPIGKGVNVGGIKNGGTQEDIARHSCIVLAPLSVMGKTVIKRQNTMGGGQEAWWRCSLNAFRVLIGTFANRRVYRYNVAIIVLCVYYAAKMTISV